MSTIEGAPQNVEGASERICRVPTPGKNIRVCRMNLRLEAPERHHLSALKGIPKSWGCLRDWGASDPGVESSSESGWRQTGLGVEKNVNASPQPWGRRKLESVSEQGGDKNL